MNFIESGRSIYYASFDIFLKSSLTILSTFNIIVSIFFIMRLEKSSFRIVKIKFFILKIPLEIFLKA